MPEGPEHHLAAKYINNNVSSLVFSGKIVKSDIANNPRKHPDVSWNVNDYKLHACARGKEVKLTLTPVITKTVTNQIPVEEHALPVVNIFFQFGMSGFFRFVPESDIPKHAHLRLVLLRFCFNIGYLFVT